MPLTYAQVKNAPPKSKAYKLSDGGGLFLLVTPSGGKWWRYKYRYANKEKLLALGTYPDVSLADARERHTEARKALAAGNDPGETKKEVKRQTILKSENTFESIALEWHEQRKHEWTPGHAESIFVRLKKHIFPKMGSRPITELTPLELLSIFRIVEKTGALDMTHRLMQYCGKVFMYAIATGRAERNPILDLKGTIKTPVRKHHAHIGENELPEYFQKLSSFDGSPITKLALKFLLLTFVRSGELRAAEWVEIDFDKAEWRIPKERMKMKESHIVPLSKQAIQVLRELQSHSGNRQHIFPNDRRPATYMSENTMLYALYRMGYHSRTTGHGFRSTACTILYENNFPSDHVERQLAHGQRDKVRASYDYAKFLPQRREMMQWWADYLNSKGYN
jgi:integrase